MSDMELPDVLVQDAYRQTRALMLGLAKILAKRGFLRCDKPDELAHLHPPLLTASLTGCNGRSETTAASAPPAAP